MTCKMFGLAVLFTALGTQACASPHHHVAEVRYITASRVNPHGEAPHAEIRLVSSAPDGTKNFVLVLAEGDEVLTALGDFARAEAIVNARLQAIGAVHDPEIAWFDLERKQYKAMTFHEQMEVLSLSGDIVLGPDGAPVVHVHAVLGSVNGRSFGGHLLHAVTNPTLEVYVTAFPEAVHERSAPEKGIDLIDLSRP